MICRTVIQTIAFQSTPPARGATPGELARTGNENYFNPRPPRGGRPQYPNLNGLIEDISIHAPREGGDCTRPVTRYSIKSFQSTPPARGATYTGDFIRDGHDQFQSTPPARGATRSPVSLINFDRISIHAPREGGDSIINSRLSTRRSISIHAPREGGDVSCAGNPAGTNIFQSTPPARGATAKMHSFICESLTNK